MNDHIKGIRSKIQEFGGFRVPNSPEKLTSKPNQLSLDNKVITTRKPVPTNKPQKPLVVEENVVESAVVAVNGDRVDQMTPTTHDIEHETVEVNAPEPEASIAEAKPVGMFLNVFVNIVMIDR